MDHNPAAIYIKDEAGRHIYGNEAILRPINSEIELDNLLAPPVMIFSRQTLQVDWRQQNQEVRDTNTRLEFDEYVETIGGKAIWRTEIKFPIQEDSGKNICGRDCNRYHRTEWEGGE